MLTEFTSSGLTRSSRVAIWLLVATVALLLVVPQVEFPDAISTRSNVLASRLSHTSGKTLTSNVFAIVVSQLIILTKAPAFQPPLLSLRTSAHHVLILHCSLRC
ncbi:MAG: hypothetical protein JST79_11820 [Acidobacteria bacterium]|nr:hypothetical protein [Acidobacteriota bacterium]